jgi:hypothetical protein
MSVKNHAAGIGLLVAGWAGFLGSNLMRMIAAAIAAAFMGLTATASFAQRAQTLPPSLAEIILHSQPRAVRFRARTAEERIAAVLRLDAVQRQRLPRVAARAALAPTAQSVANNFVLTARSPFVPGQGALHTFGATFDAWTEPVGEFHYPLGDPQPINPPLFALRIAVTDTRRLLIECTVEASATPFNGRLSGPAPTHVLIWSDQATPYQNVISFLTPAIPTGIQGEVIFAVTPTVVNQGMHGWVLHGCQVTRLSLP